MKNDSLFKKTTALAGLLTCSFTILYSMTIYPMEREMPWPLIHAIENGEKEEVCKILATSPSINLNLRQHGRLIALVGLTNSVVELI